MRKSLSAYVRVIVSAHTSLCVDPIQTYGTPEQKEKYIPDLASGKKLGAFGLTAITIYTSASLPLVIKHLEPFNTHSSPSNTAFVTFGTKENKMGICASSTYELIFTDCRIPKENLLGAKGKGFGIALIY